MPANIAKLNQTVFVSVYGQPVTWHGTVIKVTKRALTVEWFGFRDERNVADFTLRADGRYEYTKKRGKATNYRFATSYTLKFRKERITPTIANLKQKISVLEAENAKLKEELKRANFFAQANVR